MSQMTAGPAGADSVARADSDRYLTFLLAGQRYALPILDVTEIMEYRSVTMVPMMPTFLRGVINLRGQVVPVVDMAARFGSGSTEVARRTSIIIVEATHQLQNKDGAEHHIGILVDAVNAVVQLGRDDIEPPPDFGAGIRADFIAGMAKFDGEFIIVLDVSRVLTLDEVALLGEAASREGSGGPQLT